ncbi:chaperone tailless complex polypeptide 1, partial [Kipferlia bialata]
PKIGLIKFCISPPKTDMDSSVIVGDSAALDRVLRQERQYILNMCKTVRKTGCNVLLVQESTLRDAVSDLALHFFAKMKIMVIKNVARDQVDFISAATGAVPVATLDHFTADKLGSAKVAKIEENIARILECNPREGARKTCSVLVRGSNKLVLDEADRSLHDAMCVIRALVKKPHLVPGGAAVETELSRRLATYARTLEGMEQFCVKAYAEAFEVIPVTLAENAGLNPVVTMTNLRAQHATGGDEGVFMGINIKKGSIVNMLELDVMQPLLVSSSAIALATETVRMILKIDSVIMARY